MSPPDIEIASAARPHPLETVSGDTWVVHQAAEQIRLAVVDASGHGPAAAQVAALAVAALDACPDASPEIALEHCHRALSGTRGAAISIARIYGTQQLEFCGVGNVEAHVFDGDRPRRMLVHRGVVGYARPTIRASQQSLQPGWLVLLHSDGVSTRIGGANLQPLLYGPMSEPLNALLDEFGRQSDDALIVAMRWRSPLPRT